METITVVRGNEELDVPADQKERYKKLGYHVIDKKTGKVLEKAPLTDVASLQSLVVKLENENKELKAEIQKLKKDTTKKASTSTKE
ncbi:MAG: hypothetical protein IKP50_00485 [Bacilli bacterium]|nr:hypothetical protein [Bacilli bacterium]